MDTDTNTDHSASATVVLECCTLIQEKQPGTVQPELRANNSSHSSGLVHLTETCQCLSHNSMCTACTKVNLKQGQDPTAGFQSLKAWLVACFVLLFYLFVVV